LVYQALRVAEEIQAGRAGTAELFDLFKGVKPLRWLIHEDYFPTEEIRALFPEADEGIGECYTVADFPWGPGKKYLL
jgi:hypothetical protein